MKKFSNLEKNLTRISAIDLESWNREEWRSDNDQCIDRLVRMLLDASESSRTEILERIRQLQLGRTVETYAHRVSRYARFRDDILFGYQALAFAFSKESILVARLLDEKAKRLGVNSRRIRKQVIR